MTTTVYPAGYLALNNQRAKLLNLVVQIAGVPQTFSTVPIYEQALYGDPRLTYGEAGLVYGGLIAKANVMSIIKIDGGLNITQQIEPEQGRGSVATMTLQFLDQNGYMSQVISPGAIIPEPLGNALVTVWLGYVTTAFPQNYYPVFRGYITNTKSLPGLVVLEISDANVKRRQTIFFGGTTALSGNIDNVTTTIPVNNTSGFIQQIIGPNGNYDGDVTTYIKIDDEYMTYPATGITSPTSITVLSRGGSHSRGTAAASHSLGAQVTNAVQFQGNVIELGLKIMLSGWGDFWIRGVTCTALGTSLDLSNPEPGGILFPVSVDVVRDYGLVIGDYVGVFASGSGNDGLYVITDIQSSQDGTNNLVIVNTSFVLENPFIGSLGFRSQFDTFPLSCGVKNTPQDVDVQTHIDAKQLYFSASTFDEQVAILDTQNGQNAKDLIEGTLWLPAGIYSNTRYGKISIAVTQPPIAGNNLVYLDKNNVISPNQIQLERATNTRRFYNVIQFNYDLRDDGSYGTVNYFLDTSSLTKIQINSVLPINADGIKTSPPPLAGATFVQERGKFILNRYKKAAYQITLKVNFEAASQIEVGDVIALVDSGAQGDLQITNIETGQRGLGTQLFEVIQRTLSVKDGNATLTLLSNVGYKINQRFATISPSSIVTSGSTTMAIEISNSYGSSNDHKKWVRFAGLPVVVHDPLYTRSSQATFVGFDPTDNFRMLLSSALSFTPQVGDIVEVASYGNGTNPNYDALYKTLFTFIDPTLTVVSGISAVQFTVSSGDAAKILVGSPIFIHDATYSTVSNQVAVQSVVGTTVTVAQTLGFTPSAGQLVENVGWPDGGGSYLFL